MQTKQPGFTLIELIITLAIAGILMSIAVPNYRTFVLNNRMATQANDFMTAIGLARSEAVKRGTRVSICKSADNTSCTTSGNWAQGWIVFTDTGTVGDKGGTDEILQVHGPLDGASSFIGNTTVIENYITYGASGYGTLAGIGTVKLCPPSPAAVEGRDIVIMSTGRAHVLKPPATACP